MHVALPSLYGCRCCCCCWLQLQCARCLAPVLTCTARLGWFLALTLRAWRPSVRLSDCIVVNLLVVITQYSKKYESARDWIGRCLGYLHAEVSTQIVISGHLEIYWWRSVGCKIVEFCTSAASSGSHVALSQHLLSFLSPHVRPPVVIRVFPSSVYSICSV